MIVDDNSPDGTADVVKEMMVKYDNIQLITGNKEGLGRAYIRGMRYVLIENQADAIMEMDADFSHKPEDIPRLLHELEAYDFIIGSRYVADGKIPNNWGLFRKMISRYGNVAARYIAGLYHVKDCTAGFRAIKTNVLKKIDLENLNADGYCFQVALLHEAILAGAKVKEVPVEFVDRTKGKSKLGPKDVLEFLIRVWQIRLQSHKTFIKFCVVGISGLTVNLGSMYYLLQMGLGKYLASPISIEISIITNFFLNNYWTFASRNTKDRKRIKGLKFNIVSILALLISYSTFIALNILIPKISPLLAQAIGILPATFVNYFLNSYWTFRDQS